MVEEERQTQSARPDWLRPSIEQHSLRQYLTTLKKSAWVVVLAVAFGMPIVTYFIFERYFLVPLPKGPIEEWLGL